MKVRNQYASCRFVLRRFWRPCVCDLPGDSGGTFCLLVFGSDMCAATIVWNYFSGIVTSEHRWLYSRGLCERRDVSARGA